MIELAGKTAVVTGAASGIGLALAHELASNGTNVVLTDLDDASLAAASSELTSYDVAVETRHLDVADASAVAQVAAWAWDRFGRVDVLCNNAGVNGYRGGRLWEARESDWSWTFGVNVWGVVHGVNAFLPRMLADALPSHIVNTSSAASLTVPNNMYGVTKHTVLAYTEALYAQLKDEGSHVGVTALLPDLVATPFFAHDLRADTDDARRDRQAGASIRAANNELLQSQGITPETVARRAVAAIRNNELYALTHASSKDYVRRRTDELLAAPTDA